MDIFPGVFLLFTFGELLCLDSAICYYLLNQGRLINYKIVLFVYFFLCVLATSLKNMIIVLRICPIINKTLDPFFVWSSRINPMDIACPFNEQYSYTMIF